MEPAGSDNLGHATVSALEKIVQPIMSSRGNHHSGCVVVKIRLVQGVLAAVVLAGVAATPAFAVGIVAAPTALDGTMILPDPTLDHGHLVPARVANGGVAAVSAASDGPLSNCSRRNPCALPTPARDEVRVAPAENTAAVEATHGPSHKTHRVLAANPHFRS